MPWGVPLGQSLAFLVKQGHPWDCVAIGFVAFLGCAVLWLSLTLFVRQPLFDRRWRERQERRAREVREEAARLNAENRRRLHGN